MGKFIVQLLALASIVVGFLVGAGVVALWFDALVWFVAAIALNTLTLPDSVPRTRRE